MNYKTEIKTLFFLSSRKALLLYNVTSYLHCVKEKNCKYDFYESIIICILKQKKEI